MQKHFVLENVTYAYEQNGKAALKELNLSIEKGEMVAVLGHNGSGKSTLAKLLNGLYIPSDGKVLVFGMDTREEENTWKIRQKAGMVFQNPDNQLVATIVRDDVAFGMENIGVEREEMLKRIDSSLSSVGMLEFIDRAPHMLSGGQKQRVAIAGALAMEPEALIMDEATAMLDPVGRKEVFETVRRLNEEKGITIVWITHFMDEAALCDRLIVMHKGELCMDGTPSEVFSDVEKIRDLRLDVPPMTELANKLIAGGLAVKKDVLTVDDMLQEVLELWR